MVRKKNIPQEEITDLIPGLFGELGGYPTKIKYADDRLKIAPDETVIDTKSTELFFCNIAEKSFICRN